jgi:hypothetical protein
MSGVPAVEITADTDVIDSLYTNLSSSAYGSLIGGYPIVIASGSGYSALETQNQAYICLIPGDYEPDCDLENSSGQFIQQEKVNVTAQLWAPTMTNLLALRSLLRTTVDKVMLGWTEWGKIKTKPFELDTYGRTQEWTFNVKQQLPRFEMLYSSSIVNNITGSADIPPIYPVSSSYGG